MAIARQARRQPSRSSSGVKRAASSRPIGHVAVDDPHLALLAGAVPAAGGVDRDAVPAARRRRPSCRRHAHVDARRARSAGGRAPASLGRPVSSTARQPQVPRHGSPPPRPARPVARRSSACRTRRCAQQQVGRAARRRRTPATRASMIALVSPCARRHRQEAAFSACRSGMPNDMFEAPRVMFTPSFSRIRRIVLSEQRHGVGGSAPTVIASGSITMSSGGMP